MDKDQLKEIIESHQKWLNGDGGERAVLRYSDLRGCDLSGSNLSDCNLSDCNLSDCDLRGSSLRGCDLSGAKLWATIGNGWEIISLQSKPYCVTYTTDRLQIGCENHAISEWWEFDDDTIKEMERGALLWWRVWKPILQQIIKANPAKPTGAKK